MKMYTVLFDDMTVKQVELDDSDIPGMYDSGFVAGVFRLNNGSIEFAEGDWSKYTITWITPEISV